MIAGWLFLAAAIGVEIVSTSILKAAAGGEGAATHLGYTALSLAGVLASFLLMSQALRLELEISIAYAVWSGVGTAAIAIIGRAFFGEPLNAIKVISLLLIVAGVMGLNITGGGPATARPYHPSVLRVQASNELVSALRDLDSAVRALPVSSRGAPTRVR
jgi:multidrug transporter EmrE-like cation transporter